MDENEIKIELERLEFEKEKFEKELEFKRNQLELNKKEFKKRLWTNPTFIAIVAAFIGLISNAIVAYYNNASLLEIENNKAEAARILEALKTPNRKTAEDNLKFLLETGLVVNDTAKIQAYLKDKKEGSESFPYFGESTNIESSSGYRLNKNNISTSKKFCDRFLKLGTPSLSTLNICRTGYAFGFEIEHKLPGWVIYSISSKNKRRTVRRQEDWQLDPEIPSKYQTGMEFYKEHNYDRGHLISRSDVSYNDTTLTEVFLYSVCIPMLDRINRYTWRYIEQMCRECVDSGKASELLIISGPIYNENTIKDYRRISNIPDKIYRIAFDPEKLKLSAWIVPNDSTGFNKEIDIYLTSVDNIEALTGYDFFEQLPNNTELNLENKIWKSDWLK